MNCRNSYRRKDRARPGFTLIELLIVAAVFSLTVLVATTVFTNIQTTQRGILGRQRVVADGRYILEAMTRTAKLGLPDYDYYLRTTNNYCRNDHSSASSSPCNLSQPQSVLAIRDQANILICYRLCTASSQPNPGCTPNILQISSNCDGPTPVWEDITPTDLEIEDFQVNIRPVSNPFRLPPVTTSDCKTTGDCSSEIGFCSTTGVCGCTTSAQCYSGQTCVSAIDGISNCTTGPFGNTPCLCKNPDVQPSVTMFLKTRTVSRGIGSATSSLQTTVTSRVYRR